MDLCGTPQVISFSFDIALLYKITGSMCNNKYTYSHPLDATISWVVRHVCYETMPWYI